MPKFMALYVGSPDAFARSSWAKLDDSARKEREIAGMTAWGEWQEKNKDLMADAGSPLGKTKRVDGKGVSDTSNNVAGYIIIEADSHDAAAKLLTASTIGCAVAIRLSICSASTRTFTRKGSPAIACNDAHMVSISPPRFTASAPPLSCNASCIRATA